MANGAIILPTPLYFNRLTLWGNLFWKIGNYNKVRTTKIQGRKKLLNQRARERASIWNATTDEDRSLFCLNEFFKCILKMTSENHICLLFCGFVCYAMCTLFKLLNVILFGYEHRCHCSSGATQTRCYAWIMQ